MYYLANPSTQQVRDAMRAHGTKLGMIATPMQGNALDSTIITCFDNGRFGKGWPGAARWYRWLSASVAEHGPMGVLFAVAPDVPMNANATLTLSTPWLPLIRRLGIPAAFAAQDGCERGLVPWKQMRPKDVLFLGGTTNWKVSRTARLLAREALARGLAVHMGRVNSLERLELAHDFGCASADGTFMAFGPNINLPIVLGWLRAIEAKRAQPRLFDLGEAS